ncbi:MAG: Heme transporter ATP-binding protein [Actinomycetia bacterium]|nr:Heme transporter ATP-binding protein [Actinomycetes bacterium]
MAAIRLIGVTKTYGQVRANDDVHLTVEAGSVHGLLGENGAGKSTLMKILFGMTRPDAGSVEVDGVPVRLRSSADAVTAGIGMVQQHFSLVESYTVTENLVLGRSPGGPLRRLTHRLDLDGAAQQVTEMSDRFGFRIDPHARVSTLAVGARQRVEILKALWSGTRILILDEPTAALAPPEAAELFTVLRRLRDDGTTIILISHKMPEVFDLCDRVSVLRDGRVVGHRDLGPAHADESARRRLEAELVRLMIGRDQPERPHRPGEPGEPVLVARNLGGGRLHPTDLTVHAGEILGVAGVEGNGQTELVELLVGVRRADSGTIELDGHDVTRTGPGVRLRHGLAHIAEDRHTAAVAERMSIAANTALGFTDTPPLARGRWWLSAKRTARLADALIRRHAVRAGTTSDPVTSLSGGNQQKLVVGRELARAPRLMLAVQPTRGLDVGAAGAVHEALLALRDAGAGVLLVSLDLTEVMSVSDRIIVLSGGRIVGETPARDADPDLLGIWMTGARPTEAAA